jgi:hypothetical protein
MRDGGPVLIRGPLPPRLRGAEECPAEEGPAESSGADSSSVSEYAPTLRS